MEIRSGYLLLCVACSSSVLIVIPIKATDECNVIELDRSSEKKEFERKYSLHTRLSEKGR